jgi:hypothetical protein
MNAFMRRASAAESSVGKSSHAGYIRTSSPARPGSICVTVDTTDASASRATAKAR